MIDCQENLVSALKTVLPTYYELFLHSGIASPCISIQEMNNYDTETGDTQGYSRLSYRIKVWGNEISTCNKYALEIDKVLKPLGFKRVSSGELHNVETAEIQKIMTYEALAHEQFE